jgi:hypothetical protein
LISLWSGRSALEEFLPPHYNIIFLSQTLLFFIFAYPTSCVLFFKITYSLWISPLLDVVAASTVSSFSLSYSARVQLDKQWSNMNENPCEYVIFMKLQLVVFKLGHLAVLRVSDTPISLFFFSTSPDTFGLGGLLTFDFDRWRGFSSGNYSPLLDSPRSQYSACDIELQQQTKEEKEILKSRSLFALFRPRIAPRRETLPGNSSPGTLIYRFKS